MKGEKNGEEEENGEERNEDEKYSPSEELYNKEHSNIIINKLRENPVVSAKTIARTMYNEEWIWKNQIEPLLY